MSERDRSQKKEVLRLFELHEGGRLSRRQLVRGLAGLGLGSVAISWLAGHSVLAVRQARAAATTVEQRALAAAAELGKNAPKKTVSILNPSGSAGNMKPFAQEWKDATGLDIELIEAPLTEMHQKGMQEAVAKSGQYDLMLPSPFSLPDFAESGVAQDITDWVAKYDPEIDHGDSPIPYPVSEFGCKYKGRYYGIFCDGDQWLLYMRGDYLSNADEQAAFKAKYGRDLAAPKTWQEYDEVLAFFTRPDKHFWGGLEYRSPFYAKWMWMQRFCSKGKVYFDQDMAPQCDTPEGIATVNELKALDPTLPKEAYTNGWSENYNQFGQGQGFCSFSWPSFYRYNNDPKISPAVAGKIATTPVPGSMVNGELVRAAMLPFAWTFVVNAHSQIPEIAYLYAQWLTGPTMSMRAIPNAGGYFDPFRKGHFLAPSPELANAYPGGWLPQAWANMPNVIPEFCMRGTFEYSDALDKNLIQALVGQKTSEQAMKDAADEMNKITRRLGKEKQVAGWKSLAKSFPEAIKKAAGVDKWA